MVKMAILGYVYFTIIKEKNNLGQNLGRKRDTNSSKPRVCSASRWDRSTAGVNIWFYRETSQGGGVPHPRSGRSEWRAGSGAQLLTPMPALSSHGKEPSRPRKLQAHTLAGSISFPLLCKNMFLISFWDLTRMAFTGRVSTNTLLRVT